MTILRKRAFIIRRDVDVDVRPLLMLQEPLPCAQGTNSVISFPTRMSKYPIAIVAPSHWFDAVTLVKVDFVQFEVDSNLPNGVYAKCRFLCHSTLFPGIRRRVHETGPVPQY